MNVSDIEFKGARGWAAFQAYLNFVWYVPLTEHYRETGLSRSEVMSDFKGLDENQRGQVLTQCMTLSPIDDESLVKLLGVHKDNNGIAFQKSNIANLDITQMSKMVFETLLACSALETSSFF